jgi:vacuolar-type H+-ATPase subunit I/STV1
VKAQIIGAHIVYKYTAPDLQGAAGVLFYVIAAVAPLFVSSIKKSYILGIIMVLSFIASTVSYLRFLTSVWCFFAAIISFVVFYIVSDAHKLFHRAAK